MTNEQKIFISSIASYVNKYMDDYGIKVVSPIVAQAIIESNWGKSKLSVEANNYFGLKCGSGWKGEKYTIKTKEEYNGVLKTITANFRKYNSMEEGVKGYFDFINTKRYSNLKGVTDPKTYLENIKSDGYATSSSYVENVYNIVEKYGLTAYDNNNDLSNVDNSNNTVDNNDYLSLIAKDVIKGVYGNGRDRRVNLYNAVRVAVNNIVSGKVAVYNNGIELIAKDVIKGVYGNGHSTRQTNIYNAVQNKVNELMR